MFRLQVYIGGDWITGSTRFERIEVAQEAAELRWKNSGEENPLVRIVDKNFREVEMWH